MTYPILNLVCMFVCLIPIALGALLLLGAWADGADGVEP